MALSPVLVGSAQACTDQCSTKGPRGLSISSTPLSGAPDARPSRARRPRSPRLPAPSYQHGDLTGLCLGAPSWAVCRDPSRQCVGTTVGLHSSVCYLSGVIVLGCLVSESLLQSHDLRPPSLSREATLSATKPPLSLSPTPRVHQRPSEKRRGSVTCTPPYVISSCRVSLCYCLISCLSRPP